jgi:tetratricopeptide (TPR) repeat protein
MSQISHPEDGIDRLIEAADWFSQRQRHERALEKLQHALTINPNHAVALAATAMCLVRLRRPGALDAARQAIAADPEQSYAYYALAYALWDAKKPLGEITAAFEAATQLNPLHAFYVSEHAWCLHLFGNHVEALSMIDRALALGPTDAYSQTRRARILLELHEPAQALAAAKNAVSIDPEDADALAALGMALLATGEPEKAFAPLCEALRLSPVSQENQFQLFKALTYQTWLSKTIWPAERLLNWASGIQAKWQRLSFSLGGSATRVSLGVLITIFGFLFCCVGSYLAPTALFFLIVSLVVATVLGSFLLVSLFLIVTFIRHLIVLKLRWNPQVRYLIPPDVNRSALMSISYAVALAPHSVLLYYVLAQNDQGLRNAGAAQCTALVALGLMIVFTHDQVKFFYTLSWGVHAAALLLALMFLLEPVLTRDSDLHRWMISPAAIVIPLIAWTLASLIISRRIKDPGD